MKRLVSPLLLVVVFSMLSLGWRSTPPRPRLDTRSMMLAGNRLFVSGGYTGLHVYDVSDRSAPVKLARIPLEENVGSAVKGDILYANDAGQLVVMKMGTDNTYKVIGRIGVKYQSVDGPLGDSSSSFGCACSTTDYDTAPTAPGTGSSYAAFAVIDNELYRVERSGLTVYDISSATVPKLVSTEYSSWDMETIYPTSSHLFIGGSTGMYIYDRVDPHHPMKLARIAHARACDPVVVSGSTAFVTLRGSNNCGATPDELLCVSIEDPAHPEIIGEKELSTPWGLAVRDARLYVSHGQNGYSLLDVSNPPEPVIVKTWTGEPTRDFIWSDNTLFVLNDYNVSIYDVTDPANPQLLAQVESEPAL